MAKPKSWIKLNRNILEWGWYTNPNTMRVFIHLLLKANVEDKIYHGIPIKRGEILTGYPTLAGELKLTVQNVRTAIEHLKSTGEVTVYPFSKGTLIVIENYDKYQDTAVSETKQSKTKKTINSNQHANQQTANRQLTGNQHANQHATNTQTNRQLTTTKEYKNIKNIRNKEIKKNIGASHPSFSPSAGETEVTPLEWEKRIPNIFWGRFDSYDDWLVWSGQKEKDDVI